MRIAIVDDAESIYKLLTTDPYPWPKQVRSVDEIVGWVQDPNCVMAIAEDGSCFLRLMQHREDAQRIEVTHLFPSNVPLAQELALCKVAWAEMGKRIPVGSRWYAVFPDKAQWSGVNSWQSFLGGVSKVRFEKREGMQFLDGDWLAAALKFARV